MSFSSEIKEELSKIINYKNTNILEGEFLGYIMTGNSYNNDDYIEFKTDNDFNIERFYKILYALGIGYDPEVRGKTFIAIIPKTQWVNTFLYLRLNFSQEEKKAIVKGAFLGAGYVIDPEKQYHLEIAFEEKNSAEYVSNICSEFGINFKILKTKGKFHLYLKDSESISMFLALIGSNKGVLRFEDVRITKEVKNNVNRKVNCETANLNKVVNASVNQVNDILLIQKLKKFDELSPELKEIAQIRIENPDVSLKQLGEMMEKPLGKSGVNHRLQKIHEFAEELRRG